MESAYTSDVADEPAGQLHFRSVFISDIHLGSRGCKAERLIDFLRRMECDHLYLVGDIIDGWRLKKRWFWPESHGRVLYMLLERAGRGARVTYLPGNHDESMRSMLGQDVGGITVVDETVHETADGRRLLVIHGDRFDSVVRDMKWLALIGAVAYETSVMANSLLNAARLRLGYQYWSLSGYLKNQVKAACSFMDGFERSLAAEARRQQVAGVVCGHIHKPKMQTIDDVLYVNDGDWVENCSALVEHADGRLELLDWARQPTVIQTPALTEPLAAKGKRPAIAA